MIRGRYRISGAFLLFSQPQTVYVVTLRILATSFCWNPKSNRLFRIWSPKELSVSGYAVFLGRCAILETDDNKATKPCPCGFLGDKVKECSCSPVQVQRYRSRLSGPLLDRIDMHVEVPPVQVQEISSRQPGESSNDIRKRVNNARGRQLNRFSSLPLVHCNAQMGSRQIKEFCELNPESNDLLNSAIDRLGLSARAYHRILKIARTIADLAESGRITSSHVAEAIQYRRLQHGAG